MTSTDTEVVIVGAGFSGLGAAMTLLEEGQSDFVVIERADSLGGMDAKSMKSAGQ